MLLISGQGELETAILWLGCIWLKGVQSRFAHFEKFSLNFSNSSFVIRVNLRHPWPSLFLYGLLLSLWCFSILVNYYVQVSFHLKEILYVAKTKKAKHREWAPLNFRVSDTTRGTGYPIPSTLRRRILKTEVSLWRRIKCFPSTLCRRNLKTQQ